MKQGCRQEGEGEASAWERRTRTRLRQRSRAKSRGQIGSACRLGTRGQQPPLCLSIQFFFFLSLEPNHVHLLT